MLKKLKALIQVPVEVTPKDYLPAEKRDVLHIDALGLMRRNQDMDVIMHLVFREPNLKAVATKLGVDKSEVFDVMTPKQAQLVSWLTTASVVLASTGLGNNDEMRRKKLRKLYDSTLFAFK